MIDITDYNKSEFKRADPVKVSVNLKNTPELFVKLYEFNTETYYRKHLTSFKTDVNLEGLVASYEEKFTFESYP